MKVRFETVHLPVLRSPQRDYLWGTGLLGEKWTDRI